MRNRHIMVLLATAATLASCASQSKYAPKPIWAGTGINDLQLSDCNCGGLENQKAFKKHRKAEIRDQQRNAREGIDYKSRDGQD